MRKLRGKYFTVKHQRLENCNHRIDLITEPRTNCQNCWFQWFNIHPQLIETTDQFFRTKGKGPLVAMRGEKYFKMFVRFMATIIHLQKEQEKLNGANSGNKIDGGNAGERGEDSVRKTADEGGQDGSSGIGGEVSQ